MLAFPYNLPKRAARESEKVRTAIPKAKAGIFSGSHKKAMIPKENGVSHIPKVILFTAKTVLKNGEYFPAHTPNTKIMERRIVSD